MSGGVPLTHVGQTARGSLHNAERARLPWQADNPEDEARQTDGQRIYLGVE
jgi:hypothetical protein